jgi:excisionase family DNA binding protein
VSPHTIRRWTASGFLPCTRTAGGHRRIKQEDVDALAHFIGGRDHLAARLTCERQLESLAGAAVLVAAPHEAGAPLPAELAHHLARLLDARRCVISAVQPDGDGLRLRVLAAWDSTGRAGPPPVSLPAAQRPLVGRVLAERRPVVLNVGDPRADPAEVALLRRDGDACLLLIPVVHGGSPAGLIEVLYHHRERRLGPQELRLAEAAAAQVAVALRGAVADDHGRSRDHELQLLRDAIACISRAETTLRSQRDPAAILGVAASLAVQALAGMACVAGAGGVSAGATDAEACARHAGSGEDARVLSASAPCATDALTLTLTLAREPGAADSDVLGLVAALAAGALAALPSA